MTSRVCYCAITHLVNTANGHQRCGGREDSIGKIDLLLIHRELFLAYFFLVLPHLSRSMCNET